MFKKTDIPASFYSFESEKPFENCIECNSNLVKDGTPYFVEKAFRRYPGFKAFDVVYEFAMCFKCAEKMRLTMSAKSTKALQVFIESSIQKKSRAEDQPHMNACLITDQPIQEQEEYIIYGVFQGDQMMVADFPYAIGLDAMNQLSDLLSNETLDIMDDFMGKHFTGPPEVNELIGPRRPVLI